MSKARELASLGNAYSDGSLSNRNLIINGGLSVWQRGVSFSNAWNYGADRWVHPVAQTKGQSASEGSYSTFTGQGSANGAYAFTSVELPTVGNNFPFTVGKTFTLSFRVNSTSRVKPYFDFRNGVVGASNGFTTDTIDYKGGSGSWETVSWTVTVTATCGGSDNCLSISFGHEDANASVSMTQVQLEVGDTATPFEHRSYGQELALCQRYYQNLSDQWWWRSGTVSSSATGNRESIPLASTMRASPTTAIAGTNGLINIATGYPQINIAYTKSVVIDVVVNTVGSHFRYGLAFTADAEL